MSKVVVSYRRADSEAVAGRIVDRLIAHFGQDSVFLDVDNIPFGTDFRRHIQSALGQAAIMIAVVGPDWLGAKDRQHRRIDEEDDPIRLELETALQQRLVIIPVLLNNAIMPKAVELPESLRSFAFLNAAPVDAGRDFRPHVDRLIRSIEQALRPQADGCGAPGAAAAASRVRQTSKYVFAAAALVLLLALGTGAAWRFGPWTSTTLDAADDSDWNTAQSAQTYAAYAAYVKRHPNGRHVSDAAREAVAHALKAPPPIGALPTGQTVLVDDGTCGSDQVKAVTGGNVQRRLARTETCVLRADPF